MRTLDTARRVTEKENENMTDVLTKQNFKKLNIITTRHTLHTAILLISCLSFRYDRFYRMMNFVISINNALNFLILLPLLSQESLYVLERFFRKRMHHHVSAVCSM